MHPKDFSLCSLSTELEISKVMSWVELVPPLKIPFVINEGMYGLDEFFLDPLSIINMGSCDDTPKNL
nr:hypothetical protein [Tanacetum cinerariifolium]